jgi:hypothetical protein
MIHLSGERQVTWVERGSAFIVAAPVRPVPKGLSGISRPVARAVIVYEARGHLVVALGGTVIPTRRGLDQ